jgi:hypothetical protein
MNTNPMTHRAALISVFAPATSLAVTSENESSESGQAGARLSDPIFLAIQAHRQAFAAHDVAVRRRARMVATIDRDRPELVEADAAVETTQGAEDYAALALLGVRPTTIAGCVALLRYAHEFAMSGEAWPEHVGIDDGPAWSTVLFEHVAGALDALAVAA